MSEERPIAWVAVDKRTPVLDALGGMLGEVKAVLGDDEANLFHGLAIKLEYDGRSVEVPAAKVDRLTTERVYTTVDPGEIGTLPDYKEHHWFESTSLLGIFRRHPRRDGDD